MHPITVLSCAAAAATLPAGAFAQGLISGNEFNPAISVILDGQYSSYSNDPEDYAIPGFVLDDEAGLTAEGFSLDESELTLSGNIDDRFYGFADAVFIDDAGETEVELEEAYFEIAGLPAGWSVKGGKFLSAIGYLNSIHAHAWDFADEPLAYRAFFGEPLTDAGIQARWLAPTPIFLELGVEAFRGEAFPAAGSANDGVGAWSAFAKLGGDVGAGHSWKAGLSRLSYDNDARGAELENGELVMEGDGEVWIAEAVWKWAANGNPRSRNFKLQAEYLHREENGTADLDDGLSVQNAGYDLEQDGFYVQGVYQFMPRWRLGLRYDRLSADNSAPGLTAPTPLDGDDHDPERITAMVDWSRTEFSRLRLQVARDESTPDADTQVVLQYVLSLGAHGAHQF